MFLAQLCQCLPFVESVSLIDANAPNGASPRPELERLDLGVLTVREATDHVDVIIEMAGALDPQWLVFMRAKGAKVVYVCCGRPYAGLIEPTIPGRPTPFSRADRCDAVWVLPRDAEFAPMLRFLHRCPVHVVPYVWHPQFVQARIKEIDKLGQCFGYRERTAEDAGWRVAVLEPNVTVVKTSIIAMPVPDEATGAQEDSLKATPALNTLHLKDPPTMGYFANSPDLFRQCKAIFHDRFDVVGFMAEFADAVVAHQGRSDQNGSYLDVLYGDYPLVHNSTWLADAGYYLDGLDASEGGCPWRSAIANHDRYLGEYRTRTRRVIASVDPFHHDNLDAYAERLLLLRAL